MHSVSFFLSFFFWCYISASKFMLVYIYTHDCNLYVGWGVRDYSKKSIAAEKCIVVSETFMERFEKKYLSLKMYICMECQSILYKNKNSTCLRK